MTLVRLAAIALAGSACLEPPIYDPTRDGSEPALSYVLPEHVVVRPIFFVANDQQPPSTAQKERLARHLAWAQERYAEMLGQSDTFDLLTAPEIVRGARPLQSYLKLADHGVSEVMAELLDRDGTTRFNNPYVFVTVLMNATSDEPPGYGRPCNGGLDGGGGLLVVSSDTLDSGNFQSTLQHELGHAFGLPHVDAYGYDLFTSPSIMSYNVAHWTDELRPSATPGTLIPEDVRALAMNDRVFAALVFDPRVDLPAGYVMAPVVPLPAMDVPGQPPNVVTVTTPSGELFDSAASHIVQGILEPSRGPGITFDASAMWHSDVTQTGEVSADLVFPVDVTLTEIRVHSQHSGLYHAAIGVRVEAQPADSDYVQVASQRVAIDDAVRFAATSSRAWRIHFIAGDSGMVVVRGLQFFVDRAEIFPPFVPAP